MQRNPQNNNNMKDSRTDLLVDTCILDLITRDYIKEGILSTEIYDISTTEFIEKYLEREDNER